MNPDIMNLQLKGEELMHKLTLVMALVVSGAQQVPEPPSTPVNEISSGPEDTRDWVNAYFSPEVMEALWLEDYPALDRAYEAGRLVDIPQPGDPMAAALGIHLQTEGDFPIAEAERDPSLKLKLFRLAKSAAGVFYLIADHLRQLEGNTFTLLRTTSLVRTWEYQKRLMGVNANADVKAQGVPATHVTGLAFDLTRVGMSESRERHLLKFLDELRDADKIIYFTEGEAQATFHVIALLQAADDFETDYDTMLSKAAARSPNSK